jgi:hypothetical protein
MEKNLMKNIIVMLIFVFTICNIIVQPIKAEKFHENINTTSLNGIDLEYNNNYEIDKNSLFSTRYKVISDNANIRSGPGRKYRKVGVLKYGAKINGKNELGWFYQT